MTERAYCRFCRSFMWVRGKNREMASNTCSSVGAGPTSARRAASSRRTSWRAAALSTVAELVAG